MAGQPKTTFITFDVTNLVAKESPVEEFENYILDLDEEFALEVTFEGSGPGWRNMCRREAPYKVQFYAEGLGSTATDLDLGSPTGTTKLNAGSYGPYKQALTVTGGIAVEGVYRCVAVVTFPDDSAVLGFYDQLLIQINPLEYVP